MKSKVTSTLTVILQLTPIELNWIDFEWCTQNYSLKKISKYRSYLSREYKGYMGTRMDLEPKINLL